MEERQQQECPEETVEKWVERQVCVTTATGGALMTVQVTEEEAEWLDAQE